MFGSASLSHKFAGKLGFQGVCSEVGATCKLCPCARKVTATTSCFVVVVCASLLQFAGKVPV